MTVRFSNTRLRLLGSGSALPGQAVGNDSLLMAIRRHCGARNARLAEKIVGRLGIRSRYLSRDLTRPRSGTRPGYTAPELCCDALDSANARRTMSYLIGHTATPHTLLPPNVAWVAERLGYDGPYMELRQACTGFAAGLTAAAGLIAENPAEIVAIVGSETGSPFFDFSSAFATREQLVNCVQMGDGAGAIVVAKADGGRRHTISDIFNGQLGVSHEPGIAIEGGGSFQPDCEPGLPFFRHRSGLVRTGGEELLLAGIDAIEGRGHALDEFDWIIPHQANGLMAELMAERLPGLAGRVFVVADILGNLGSAAIWVALDRLRQSGNLESGHRVLVLGAEASKYMLGGFVYTH